MHKTENKASNITHLKFLDPNRKSRQNFYYFLNDRISTSTNIGTRYRRGLRFANIFKQGEVLRLIFLGNIGRVQVRSPDHFVFYVSRRI